MFRISRYHKPTRSTVAPGVHVLVYDGDCGFCLAAVRHIQSRSRDRVELVPFSELDRTRILTSLDEDQVFASAHYVTPDGLEYHGGESITRAMRLTRGGAIFRVVDIWGISLLREIGYTIMAGNRPFFSRLTSVVSRRSNMDICSTDAADDALSSSKRL